MDYFVVGFKVLFSSSFHNHNPNFTAPLYQAGFACFCGHSHSHTRRDNCWNLNMRRCTGDDTALCGGIKKGTAVYRGKLNSSFSTDKK